MAEELKNMEAEEESNRFSLTVTVIEDKLELHLHDKHTKYMYHESFGSEDLQKCGFGHNQASNLDKVAKFMESARKGHSSLQFEIKIEKNPNNQITDGDTGIVCIVKEDEFFPIEITMKLKQTPRKKIDILEEHIHDLKKENAVLRNQVQELIPLKDHVMPKNSIIMWSGNMDDIPKGWSLCNGENNTPDLRNRFIIGASDEYKAQSIGGNKAHNHNITVQGHQLTIREMPRHSHSPQKWIWCHDDSYSYKINRGSSGNGISYNKANSEPTGGNQAHSHNATSAMKYHLPPYYAMCFIIKLV